MKSTAAHISEFLEYLQKEKRGSVHTLRCYRSDLNQLSRFFAERFEESDLLKAKSDWIRTWVVEMMREGKAPRTIHRKVSAYRTFVRFARRTGQMESDPAEAVTLPKLDKRLPEVVPEYAMRELMDVGVFAEDWKGRRDRSILALLYETGIRLSELIGLRLNDVDSDRKELRVWGKGFKERRVPLLPETLEAVEEHLKLRPFHSDYLFITDAGRELYPSFVYRRVNHYLNLVSSLHKTSPHVLRHTFCSRLAMRGATAKAIQELAGHADLSTTQRYLHLSPAARGQAIGLLEPTPTGAVSRGLAREDEA